MAEKQKQVTVVVSAKEPGPGPGLAPAASSADPSKGTRSLSGTNEFQFATRLYERVLDPDGCYKTELGVLKDVLDWPQTD